MERTNPTNLSESARESERLQEQLQILRIKEKSNFENKIPGTIQWRQGLVSPYTVVRTPKPEDYSKRLYREGHNYQSCNKATQRIIVNNKEGSASLRSNKCQ